MRHFTRHKVAVVGIALSISLSANTLYGAALAANSSTHSNRTHHSHSTHATTTRTAGGAAGSGSAAAKRSTAIAAAVAHRSSPSAPSSSGPRQIASNDKRLVANKSASADDSAWIDGEKSQQKKSLLKRVMHVPGLGKGGDKSVESTEPKAGVAGSDSTKTLHLSPDELTNENALPEAITPPPPAAVKPAKAAERQPQAPVVKKHSAPESSSGSIVPYPITDGKSVPHPQAAPIKTAINGAPESAPEACDATGMDSALVSVLRDISKELSASDDVQKLESAIDRSALESAISVLNVAISPSTANANRIVAGANRNKLEKTVAAESWESGEVTLPNGCHGSMNVLWAKKINGLLNLTIAGTCKVKTDEHPTGTPVEFVVVINGKSTLDSGFDIQSQANVNYWLGKLSNFTIDAGAPGEPQANAGNPPILRALLTTRRKQWLLNQQAAAMAVRTEAAPPEKKSDSTGAPQGVAGAAAAAAVVPVQKSASPATEASVSAQPQLVMPVGQPMQIAADNDGNVMATNETVTTGVPALAESRDGGSDKGTGPLVVADAGDRTPNRTSDGEPATGQRFGMMPPVNAGSTLPLADNAAASASAAQQSGELPPVASASDERRNRATNHSATPAGESAREPSSDAQVIAPDRAVAGEYMTVAVASKKTHKTEPYVSLSFNGSLVTAAADGRVVFQVPDEAAPGPSLQISLAAKPEIPPKSVNVLQPLIRASSRDLPHIDRVSDVATTGSTFTIDGHNFDGMAQDDHVIIDGRLEGKILVASPVQMKVLLPAGVVPGHHSVIVTSNGLRSNAGKCEVIAVEVEPLGKPEKTSQWLVRVVGTQDKVRVRVLNDSPNLIKLVKGNQQTVVTDGGANNHVLVNALRLNRGVIRLTTRVEALQ